MKTRILKYEIPFPKYSGSIMELKLHSSSEICDINNQGDKIFLWAISDESTPIVTKKIVIYGTGCDIENHESLYFLKTIHMPNGLVWHVFAIIDEVKDEI